MEVRIKSVFMIATSALGVFELMPPHDSVRWSRLSYFDFTA